MAILDLRDRKKKLAKYLREIMINAPYTVQDVARATNVSFMTVARFLDDDLNCSAVLLRSMKDFIQKNVKYIKSVNPMIEQ